MVDPLRKQRLGRGATIPLKERQFDQGDLIVRSYHPTKPGSVDLTSLAAGTSHEDDQEVQRNHGRPLLAKAFLHEFRSRYSQATHSTLKVVYGSLRQFWTFLDTLEGMLAVTSIGDIHDAHGVLWLRRGVDRTTYGNVRLLIGMARRSVGLMPLYWPPRPSLRTNTANPPDPKWIRLIYRELKDGVRNMLFRWSEADRLAAAGSIRFVRTVSNWTVESMHATYRAALESLGEPLARPKDILRAMGLSDSREGLPIAWGMQHGDMLATLYPSKLDVLACFHLVLIKTGWNPQVALDIDVTNPHWSTCHPTSPDVMVLESKKERGGKVQHAISPKRHTFSPYKIISTLIERTKPLRDHCQIELDRARAAFLADPSNHELSAEVAMWQRAVRSPWLHIEGHRTHLIKVLTNHSYISYGGNAYLAGLVKQINAEAIALLDVEACNNAEVDAKQLIPSSVTATDLRDAFIDHAYRASGYNWLVAKVAAGHSSMSALRHYLRRHQYRKHSETQVRKLQDAIFSEIEQKRVIDPVILKALVERGDLTQEQRDRWLEHKALSRMDMGCLDPRNPPSDIAPHHKQGSTCRVQRCILCPKGIVLKESLRGLARRKAELGHILVTAPMLTWIEGNFADEMQRLEATLAQFDLIEVRTSVADWGEKIAKGEHVVMEFEGSYDSPA
jgi:hypothetical protein